MNFWLKILGILIEGAVEIKLGGDKLIEEGAKSLKTLKAKIEEKSDEKSPS